MSDARAEAEPKRARARRAVSRRELALALVIVAGLSLSALFTRRLDANPRTHAAAAQAAADTDALYVSPEAARRMSLGFNGLAADWYWMRALQYVGRKVVAHKGDLRLDDLSQLGLTQLSPLLEQATTLDPEFMAAYEFGAVVLPALDEDSAVRLLHKGIRDNPRAWQLRHHLGYIHWTRGQFREAADAYADGARVEGAPPWMGVMAAQMEVGGGSRATARAIYARMLEGADDENVKGLARLRLAQVDSLDERDRLRQVLSAARAQLGRCPQDWRGLNAQLRAARLRLDASGAPLDPADVPYVLDASACDVRLNARSPIPQK